MAIAAAPHPQPVSPPSLRCMPPIHRLPVFRRECRFKFRRLAIVYFSPLRQAASMSDSIAKAYVTSGIEGGPHIYPPSQSELGAWTST